MRLTRNQVNGLRFTGSNPVSCAIYILEDFSMSKSNRSTFINVLVSAIAIIMTFGMILGISYYTNAYAIAIITNHSIKDTLLDGGGKTARVILLAGQSNAAGCSRNEYLKNNVSAELYADYEEGFENVLINSKVTYYTNDTNAFVKTKLGLGDNKSLFGPEVGMADRLHERFPNEVFFIIKYAWSGSSMPNLWESPSTNGRVGQLYTPFVDHVHNSIKYLKYKNYNVKIDGFCWMQGESDAMDNEARAYNYRTYLSNFINDIRSEFEDYASKDGIKFVDAYISDSSLWTEYQALNESKDAVASMSNLNVVVDTLAHGLRYDLEPFDNPDVAHYDSLSELKLGQLFIEYLYD